MASILINNEQDSKFLDNWNKIVPQNIFNKNKNLFRLENYNVFDIDSSYNFRPDKIAYKVYKNDYYYPIILICNNIGSFLQFNTDKIGFHIYYLDPKLLSQIIL